MRLNYGKPVDFLNFFWLILFVIYAGGDNKKFLETPFCMYFR